MISAAAVGAHGLHGLQGLHAFFAAQGLQGLHAFFAAHGLHGLQPLFFAAQGLRAAAVLSRGTKHFEDTPPAPHGPQGPQAPFAAQGLHGLHGPQPFFAAQGLHGLHGRHAASWMEAGFGLATGSGFIRSADGPDAYPGPLGATAPPTTTPAPTSTGINVLERSFDFIDLTTWPPLASLFVRGNAQICCA